MNPFLQHVAEVVKRLIADPLDAVARAVLQVFGDFGSVLVRAFVETVQQVVAVARADTLGAG